MKAVRNTYTLRDVCAFLGKWRLGKNPGDNQYSWQGKRKRLEETAREVRGPGKTGFVRYKVGRVLEKVVGALKCHLIRAESMKVVLGFGR